MNTKNWTKLYIIKIQIYQKANNQHRFYGVARRKINLRGIHFEWFIKAKKKSKKEDLRVPWAAKVEVGIWDSLTVAETIVVPKADNIWISKGIGAYFYRGIINTLLICKKEKHWPYVTRAKR